MQPGITPNMGMTIQELARRLAVHRNTIQKYISDGELEAYKVGGKWRVTEEALQKFIASRKNVRNRPAA